MLNELITTDVVLDMLDANGVNTTRVAPEVAEALRPVFSRIADEDIAAFIAMAPTDYSRVEGFTSGLLDEFLSTFVATYADPISFAKVWAFSGAGFLAQSVPTRFDIAPFVDFLRVFDHLASSTDSPYVVIGDGPVFVFARRAGQAQALPGASAGASAPVAA